MTRKTSFFDGWSWLKFNNLGPALSANLRFYISVAKRFKLKVRKFWCLIVEITGEKLVGGLFCPHPLPPILNRVKEIWFQVLFQSLIRQILSTRFFSFWMEQAPGCKIVPFSIIRGDGITMQIYKTQTLLLIYDGHSFTVISN